MGVLVFMAWSGGVWDAYGLYEPLQSGKDQTHLWHGNASIFVYFAYMAKVSEKNMNIELWILHLFSILQTWYVNLPLLLPVDHLFHIMYLSLFKEKSKRHVCM